MEVVVTDIRRIFRIALLAVVLAGSAAPLRAQDLGALFDKLFKRDEAQDTTDRIRSPLESYFFDDSTRKQTIFAWNVAMGRNAVQRVPVDTLLADRMEVDYPFLRQGVGSAYLGNLGGAALPLNYFDRPASENFSFTDAYNAYLKNPSNARFFNVKKPFTHLTWYMSGQSARAEEQLRVLHAQNISPSTGFNVDYLNRGTRGIYAHQEAKDKNLSLAFSHTGKKYAIHAGYIHNMGNLNENGGVIDSREVTDTVIVPAPNVKMRLTDANNVFKGNTFYLTQTFGIPFVKITEDDFTIADKPAVFFGHALDFTRYHKTYTDTEGGTKWSSGTIGEPESHYFYDHWYLNPEQTRDSINEMLLDNRLFLQIQPWNRDGIIGTIDGGVGYAYHRYYNFRPEQYVDGERAVTKDNAYIYGTASGKFRNYLLWNADVKYYAFGYRSQDLKFNAELALSAYIKSRPITLSVGGFVDSRTPDYWSQHYFSNHYVWDNDFGKETETRLQARLDIPSAGLEAGAWQSVITNKVYFGADALPAQYSGTLSLSAIYLRKDFTAGVFHFNHRLLAQWSSDSEVAPVPLGSAYIAYYAEFNLVRNVLRMQLGVDGRCNTKYYAPGYMPATMQFYNQREVELG
ncbi:MAG: putative porin, partial [Rikenellaceae bacterium]|nr:putative porin [Rikenellaceae bacterium]